MPGLIETYDVVVVGAGHAGCEAALASARLGLETIMFTVSVESIALMPCNPNIGGSSKGHLVREIDALGGEMGKNIDKTFIQSKMLNTSKGPSVHSLRAQADKQAYSLEMRRTLENTDHLTILQAEVAEILTEENRITGVKTYSGAVYQCQCVVLATGTYLKARCIYGDVSTYTGPNGLQAANHLTDSLKALGIEMFRFKTGTPARVDKRSIDFSKMEEQFGDERIVPFSFTTDPDSIQKEQDRDIVLPLKIRWYDLLIKIVIRFLLSRRDSILMRCIWAVCRVLCRRMFSMPCTEPFRDWRMPKSSEMPMPLNMTASIRVS